MVTQYTAQTVYMYAERKLWAAYGTAILVTLTSVILGIISILTSGASYSNDFSTIFLNSRNAELSVEVDDIDKSGKDPLPKYLQKATVAMIGDRKNTQTISTSGANGAVFIGGDQRHGAVTDTHSATSDVSQDSRANVRRNIEDDTPGISNVERVYTRSSTITPASSHPSPVSPLSTGTRNSDTNVSFADDPTPLTQPGVSNADVEKHGELRER